MFILLLKTEKPGGMTSVGFVGMYGSLDKAMAQAGRGVSFGDSSFGNHRMLTARNGLPIKSLLASPRVNGSIYLIAEY